MGHLCRLVFGTLVFLLPNGISTQAAIARNRKCVYAVAAGAEAVLIIGLSLFLIPGFGALGAAWATVEQRRFL